MNYEVVRSKNLNTLSVYGFKVASSLPLSDSCVLRSYEEIASRLYALNALIYWVALSEEQISSELIESYIERNRLKDYMTSEELEIISLGRLEANEQYIHTIGWRLENMWALAWALGFDIEPNVNIGQLPDDVTKALIFDFLPGLDSTINDLINSNKARTAEEVLEFEDLYYCAHNAVRSAQLGERTVPDNYNPIIDGGAVHERRHSLTWCLSPCVEWDETDLST